MICRGYASSCRENREKDQEELNQKIEAESKEIIRLEHEIAETAAKRRTYLETFRCIEAVYEQHGGKRLKNAEFADSDILAYLNGSSDSSDDGGEDDNGNTALEDK